MRIWALGGAEGFSQAALQGVRVHPDSLAILAPLDEEENLALGRAAVDEFGKRVPLSDGSAEVGRSEWLSGTPNVFGRTFTVDLGLDRAVTRVRILPGGTALAKPEYFIRGYRLEIATQLQPDIWHRLAEQRTNFVLTVDTRQDSTWSVVDSMGRPLPSLGRYVRLTLIRQDRSNWVALGDIEVFGTGYVSRGEIAGEFALEQPVNVGQIRWQEQVPPQTEVLVQLRGSNGIQELPAWDETAHTSGGEVFAGAEPVARLQYRGVMQTADPFATPALRRLEVDYDPVLVAQEVLGAVVPDTARKGVETALTYRVSIEVDPGDYGIDLLRLDAALAVEGIRFKGVELGYEWHSSAEEGRTFIALRERLGTSGMLEIAGKAVFLEDRTAIPLAVGSLEQEQRDGYVNWQNAREASDATWTVRGFGAPPELLSKVDLSPRPFSPFRDEAVNFRFVVSNLQENTEVAVEVFTLTGERVRRLSQVGGARLYHFEWDGRDHDGRIAAPGLYLYEIRVEAGENAASHTGTLVVAY